MLNLSSIYCKVSRLITPTTTLLIAKRSNVTKSSLVLFISTVAIAIIPAYAELGDQKIVRDVVGDKGWTSIVPMNIDKSGPTDLLFYNAATGRAAYVVGVGKKADQKIVRDVVGDKGWTYIGHGLTDLLFYNAATGRAAYTVLTDQKGDQKIVRDVIGDKGWTSVVPITIASSSGDLLFYNAATGRAAFVVGINKAGDQKIVRDFIGDKGWSSIVPMNIDNDFAGATDFLFYNAATGRAAYTVTVDSEGNQKIVRDVIGDKGWTSIVPMNIDNKRGTDLLFYNAATGRAVYTVAVGEKGDQKIVRDVTGDKGWTSIVPMDIDTDLNGFTDLLFYNAETGRAAYTVDTEADQPIPPH